MSVWMIGDLHFDHKNIIEYCRRPFNTVEEMNETIIYNWNKVIKKEDKVFVVGDFSLGSKIRTIEFGKKLKGHKTLILGNHDRYSRTVYYDAGFEYISKYPIIWNEFFIISHEPQYTQENSIYVNIYAHVHDNPTYKNYSSNSFCVSAERINYTPINFNMIHNIIKGEQK